MTVTGMSFQADLSPSPRVESDGPLVSVVVTTYVRERLDDVLGLLRSLAKQTYSRVEIIFVGERMRELPTLVDEGAARNGIANLRVVFNDRPGLSQSRNLGALLARGEIVAFIDDDAIALDDWIEEIVKVFVQHPDAIGMAGAAQPLWEDASMEWFPEEFFWIISCPVPAWTGMSRLQQVRNAWGINMAFRKEALEAVSFSEIFGVSNRGQSHSVKLGLSGDDTEFCMRLRHVTGRPILFNPDCRVVHRVQRQRLSTHFTRRRAFWEGYTKATIVSAVRAYGDGAGRFRLSTELTVFRQILFSFVPRMLSQFFRHPRVALRQLGLAVDVLTHFALGYAAARISWPGASLARRYSR
jgi:cellulose synthase/poly-beta-1,6-N-acetylglucosamine synthase-like glycosyltransferase